MSRVKRKKAFIPMLAVLLVTASVWGCSQSPLSPDSGTTGSQLLMRSPGAVLPASSMYEESVISAERGGRLELFDVVLEVPKGAVANDTLFSISIPDAAVFYNEFGTSGLVFDKPVKVTMSYRDANLTDVNVSTIRIAWLNNATMRWEDVKCDVDHVNKVVVAYLDHFSAYGLISD